MELPHLQERRGDHWLVWRLYKGALAAMVQPEEWSNVELKFPSTWATKPDVEALETLGGLGERGRWVGGPRFFM